MTEIGMIKKALGVTLRALLGVVLSLVIVLPVQTTSAWADPIPSNDPPVGIAAHPKGHGYWLAAADGGIFSFGTAGFHGSMGGKHLNAPVVGITATPDGKGYWLAAADGDIFSFGTADFHGSMGGKHLNAPVVGITA
ncbi:hypothetical protein, partial [Sphaerisporangium aureirubrum]|uniref:hypothetical protein n=1 Tax=Sphaerisporangium aureirubrum TaxID=1544736 RepID=UPI00362EB73B